MAIMANSSTVTSGTVSAISGASLVGSTISGAFSAGTGLWSNPTYTATATPYNNATLGTTAWSNTANTVRIMGDAEFEGEVTSKGVKLDDRLNAIEDRLAILRPNHDLEGKWEELKELGERYRQLEKEILEKESMWDILKK